MFLKTGNTLSQVGLFIEEILATRYMVYAAFYSNSFHSVERNVGHAFFFVQVKVPSLMKKERGHLTHAAPELITKRLICGVCGHNHWYQCMR